jgi:acyl carrier protein
MTNFKPSKQAVSNLKLYPIKENSHVSSKLYPDVWVKVVRVLVDTLGIDNDEVTEHAHIHNDLGADSLDHVEIIMNIEKEFNFSIPDDEAEYLITPGQFYDYIVKKGP